MKLIVPLFVFLVDTAEFRELARDAFPVHIRHLQQMIAPAERVELREIMERLVKIIHPVPAAVPFLGPFQRAVRIRVFLHVRGYGVVHQIDQLAFEDRPCGRDLVTNGGGNRFLHAVSLLDRRIF